MRARSRLRESGRASGALALAVAFAFLLCSPAGAQAAADWPGYLYGPGHSSYNAAATAITVPAIQAGDLQPVWQWLPPAATNGGSTNIWASPTVVDGVAYVGVEDGEFYAIDEATQTVLWSQFLGYDTVKPDGQCFSGGLGITSTATVAPDPMTGNPTVYVFGPDGNLYALDAASGDIDWKSAVDMPSLLVEDYYSWSSPLVANGKVYIGIASECDKPLVPAGLVAFDQESGAKVATWSSLPPGLVGGSIWSSAGELANGDIAVTTGNGPGSESDQPLYNETIADLNGSTLALQDYWQVPLAQRIGDGDFGGSPTDFTADLDSVTTQMVGACNKNGVYYAFKQSDLAAGPVWHDQINSSQGNNLCIDAAIWNGQDLIEGGTTTTIAGKTYSGTVEELDPATGAILWQTGLPGPVLGSPTEDGSGVVAVAVDGANSTSEEGVYLLDASTGASIGFVPTYGSDLFAQPVVAGNDLLVTGPGVTAYEVTTPGPAITNVSPSAVAPATSTQIELTGSGFSGSPSVFVSGGQVSVSGVDVVSPTTLTFSLYSPNSVLLGSRNITVIEPGSPDTASTCSDCLAVSGFLTSGTSSSTGLGSSMASPLTGEHVTYTATVTPVPSGGIVYFADNHKTITGCGDVTVNHSTGVATCTIVPTSTGPASIVATYSGDNTLAGSVSGTLSETVQAGPTTTTLASSANPASTGQAITYTAKVAPLPDGGTVAFADGAGGIGGCGAVAVNATTGTATCTATGAAGTHAIVATYSGDTNWQGSVSSALTETVNAPPTNPAPPVTPPAAPAPAVSAAAITPSLSALRIAPSTIGWAARRPGRSTRRSTQRHKSRATVTYTLNEAASTTVTFGRSVSGRLSASGACVPPSRANRHADHCTRTVVVPGTLSEAGVTGANSFTITARLDGKLLSPGSYTLVVTASAGGLTSLSQTASFEIKR